MTLLCSVFELRLQHTNFTAEQLRAGEWKQHTLQTQEVALINFCANWLNEQAVFTFQTSGSTGTPKSIELTRAQLLASTIATINVLKLDAYDHALLCLSPGTIAGSMMAVRAMQLHIPLTFIEPSATILSQLSETHPYTFAAFVPAQLFAAENYSAILNRFNAILIGGAALNGALEHTLTKLKPRIYHTYGMTETASHIALRELHSQQQFYALPGIELKTDARGCLCVKGDVTQHEWIITNDIAELNDNGFYIVGRADYVINTGGNKVHPEVIEQLLHGMEWLKGKNYFIAGMSNEQWGQEVVLIIESTQAIEQQQWQELQEYVITHAGKAAVPRRFIAVSQFRYTHSGKTDRLGTINILKM